MKYKVGDIVSVKGKNGIYKILKAESCNGIGSEIGIRLNRYFLEQISDKSIVVIRDERLLEEHRVEIPKQTTLNHESVIIQLTELNALKTRQLDELMKFIAHLVPKAHKEYLSHHLNDVQLIDGIMYHVRKGK